MFRSIKKIHFVGIGGIGMSGIAEMVPKAKRPLFGMRMTKLT